MLKRKEKTQFESPDRLNRIVEGTKIIGDLISESNIRIDGEVIGNIITSSKVVIGENGFLKGNLNCQEADIEGKIEGKLEIEGLLILREQAKVNGDINTVKLHIEEGAFFLGACKMISNSMTSQNTTNYLQEKEVDDVIY
jgi:cytoskeletal protein CcmA (bactofilin family)